VRRVYGPDIVGVPDEQAIERERALVSKVRQAPDRARWSPVEEARRKLRDDDAGTVVGIGRAPLLRPEMPGTVQQNIIPFIVRNEQTAEVGCGDHLLEVALTLGAPIPGCHHIVAVLSKIGRRHQGNVVVEVKAAHPVKATAARCSAMRASIAA
jgi:hypothetical protein